MDRDQPGTPSASSPEMIGPYRLEEKIGAGGMGVVYRAFDERLERRVAIKHIRRREAKDQQARERLRREARTVASLNHPAIVQIHDIIDAENGDWIVMELVEGNTIHQMLQSGPLPVSQALYLALEIADGLAEAHGKGVVHRDLKTENVMVTPSGHAKILDFGLAKRLWTEKSGKDISLSAHGTILGTGRAMSPEQVLGEDVDHRSDLFSFGTLLYEMVSGERPFMGSSLVLTMAQVCSEEHRSLKLVQPELPPELVTIVDRLLQKKPEQRPQSAREMAAILSNIAGIPLPERSSLPGAKRLHPDWENRGDTPPEPTPTEVVPLQKSFTGQSSASLDVTGESTTGIFLKTLVKVTLEDKERLREKLGGARVLELFGQHERLVQSLVEALEGRRIDSSESLLVTFERPIDAVQFALDHRQQLMELGAENGVTLTARAGIHLGEILVREQHLKEVGQGSGSLGLEGPARQVVSRLVTLAQPGQVLVTREASQLSRHALDGRLSGTAVRWREHGRYLFDGVDDPVVVFEVGAGRPRALVSRVPGVQKLDQSWWQTLGRRELLAAGFLVALLLVVGFRLAERSETEVVAARPSVAVFQFKNLGQPEQEWLSTALSELFVAELEGGQQLRMIAGENISRVQVEISGHEEPLQSEMLRRVRRLLGADYLLVGSFLVQGNPETGKVTLVLRLQDTRQRETVALLREEGAADDLSSLVQKLGDDLRGHMGVERVAEGVEAPALNGALPHNANAMKAYSEGLQALRGFELRRAQEAFERVVAIEPKNAIGHAGLSQAWRALGYDDNARKSARRAYDLSMGLPRLHALSIEGHYYEAKGEWPQAINAYRKLLNLNPDDVDHGLLLAEAQVSGGRGAEALATLAALRRLPPPAGEDPRIELATAAAKEVLAEHQAMLGAARAALARVAVNEAPFLVAEGKRLEGFAHYYLGEIELADESLGEALQLFDQARNRRKMADILSVMAFLRSIEGELSAAEEHLRQALDLQREVGSIKGISRAQNGLAYMLQAKGELLEARDLLRKALVTARAVGDRGREATYLGSLTWVSIKLGDLETARQMAAELKELAEEIGDREELTYSSYYSGRVAAETGDFDLALSHYREALSLSYEIGGATLSGFALRGLMEVELAMGQLAKVASFDLEAQAVEAGFHRQWEGVANQLARARLRRDQGQAAEAVELAQDAAARFGGMERRDEEMLALFETVLALWDQRKIERAGEVLKELRTLQPEESENPRVRLASALLQGRSQAEGGDWEGAHEILGPALKEAQDLGLMAWQLELGLAFGETEVALNSARGEEHLLKLATKAEKLGYRRVAHRARVVLKTSRG